MSPIVSILRAAHCRSTHHYFAIDALSRIETAQGLRLRDLLLKHHDEYLIGSKAPDKSFRDFENHVLHVGDNHWGGAAKKCQEWLDTTIEHLDRGHWKKAAYACGVLSHYFTDPIMPLHTGQSDREAVVHRPMEWSICKDYNAIAQLSSKETLDVNFQLAQGSGWISKAVTAAAKMAHLHYHRLIEIYDIEQGAIDPPRGLNLEARIILSELFGIALEGWARVLTRIADETSSEIPKTSLTLTTLLASIDMPLAWLIRRMSNASEQRAVNAIFKEFATTGKVVKHLPPEIRQVRQQRAENPPAVKTATSVSTKPSLLLHMDGLSLPALPLGEPPGEESKPDSNAVAGHALYADQELNGSAEQKAARKDRIHWDSDLVDAPSIGPKTARRFETLGMTTIAQFVAGDVESLATRLGARWITPTLLADWQAQARLVCEVPVLCGYKAQLLVAVGCCTSRQLRESAASELYQLLTEFYQSKESERILRNAHPPTLTDVARWITTARELPAKAA